MVDLRPALTDAPPQPDPFVERDLAKLLELGEITENEAERLRAGEILPITRPPRRDQYVYEWRPRQQGLKFVGVVRAWWRARAPRPVPQQRPVARPRERRPARRTRLGASRGERSPPGDDDDLAPPGEAR
jgi:hypothetical protein